ncbi:MAG: adenine deaminase, partial [Methanothrix sp.]
MEMREELIAAARGEIEVDLLLAGGRLANVLSGEVYRADVAVHRGRIVGFECSNAKAVLELDGGIIAPG